MITQKHIPISTLHRSGIKLDGVKFIVCHDTGNAGSTAIQNVNWYTNPINTTQSSAHAFVDDKGVIECIPLDERAYHVRRIIEEDNRAFQADAIDASLGIELCYGGRIDNKRAYQNYCDYIAELCKRFSLDPDKHLIGHYKLDPSRRTDPLNAFKLVDKDWQGFINDIKERICPVEPVLIKKDPKEHLRLVITSLEELLYYIKEYLKSL